MLLVSDSLSYRHKNPLASVPIDDRRVCKRARNGCEDCSSEGRGAQTARRPVEGRSLGRGDQPDQTTQYGSSKEPSEYPHRQLETASRGKGVWIVQSLRRHQASPRVVGLCPSIGSTPILSLMRPRMGLSSSAVSRRDGAIARLSVLYRLPSSSATRPPHGRQRVRRRGSGRVAQSA